MIVLFRNPVPQSEIRPEMIVPGVIFDTEFETNCVVLKGDGFLALDSDYVESEFFLEMVTQITGVDVYPCPENYELAQRIRQTNGIDYFQNSKKGN